MRSLILLDSATVPRKQDVEVALGKIRDDYAPATPVTWAYEVKDFSSLKWIDYLPGALGVSYDTINSITQELYKRDGEKWDNVIFVIDPMNWKAPNIGGWNLGYPRHGYSVQLILASLSPVWLYKIFAMEIAHSWNDLCIQEISDNLLSTFNVRDFANQVIHGVDSRYGVDVPPNAPMTGYYTDYNYRPMIAIAKEKLALAYSTRIQRYETGTYKFRRDLYIGISGDDVIELQKRFAREGVASYAPTGYFGEKTKASAIAYQKKNGILPQLGFVGTKTRAVLNGGIVVVPTPSNVLPEAEAILLSELAMRDSA